jgi:hypothetical protein
MDKNRITRPTRPDEQANDCEVQRHQGPDPGLGLDVAQSAEPPDTDPYIRWCGRGVAARLPPIPIGSCRPPDSRGALRILVYLKIT